MRVIHRIAIRLHRKGCANRPFFHIVAIPSVRHFLSDAYRCEDVWANRFQASLMQNVKMGELFFEIDKKLATQKKVSAVDIDLFAHNVTTTEELAELESILHRFRKTKATVRTLDSTHYAVVRAFLDQNEMEPLLKILSDRTGFGIFPDHHGYNMILDKLLQNENYRDATKTAILMMLQEDLSNSIGNTLALYACHMYLQKPQPEPWEPEPKEVPPDDNDEDVFIRIPFLRTPYFDDHFDISNQMHLIGKTLYMLGKEHCDEVGRSYQLIGLGLYEKWDKSRQFLDKLIVEGRMTVLEEAVSRFKEMVEKIPDEEDKIATKNDLKVKLDELVNKQCVVAGNLDELVKHKLASITQYEKNDIEEQKTLFGDWEIQRKKSLDEDLHEIAKKEMKKTIEAKKKELKEKEEELFFFENLDKHELELAEIAESMKALAKTKTDDDESYVPPEVQKPIISK